MAAAVAAISVDVAVINQCSCLLGLQVDWPDESRSFFTREDGESVTCSGSTAAAEGYGEGSTVE